MNPPLLEVNLDLHFDPLEYFSDRLQLFARNNTQWLRKVQKPDSTAIACFVNADEQDLLALNSGSVQLKSTRGISYARLRPEWIALLTSVHDVIEVPGWTQVSLSYFNEIPIDDLRSFRNTMNICFEMPSSLTERIEFFRTEFTYKFPFGETHLWVQPDWNERLEHYCIQMSIEARAPQRVACEDLERILQQLHEGNKEVFHQILSRDYISRLPQ